MCLFFELLCVFGYNKVVDAILNITIHKCRQVIYSVVDAVVGDYIVYAVIVAEMSIWDYKIDSAFQYTAIIFMPYIYSTSM